MTWRVRIAMILLGLGLAGLQVCWAVSNPIGAAPDEPAHYIKALAVGQGELRGSPVDPAEFALFNHNLQTKLNALIRLDTEPLALKLTRRVTIPPVLQPNNAACTAFEPAPATCIDRPPRSGDSWGNGSVAYTYVGTYQPFVYVIPGLAMQHTSSVLQAFVVGRLTFVAMALLLIGLGGFLYLAVAGWPLGTIGLLAAVTPMVVSTSATLSASSPEIAAGVAAFGALLHLVYRGSRPRLAWGTLALGGITLAVSRSLGPLWVGILLSSGLGLLGFRSAWTLVVRRRPWALFSMAAIGVSCVIGLAWQVLIQPRPILAGGRLFLDFVHGFEDLPRIMGEEIGVFGWLDTRQPGPSYILWAGLLWGLVAIALYLGSRRERWTLASLVGINLLLGPILNALIAAPSGGGVQGRWLLPIAVAVPLLGGVIVGRSVRLAPNTARLVTLGIAAGAALIQFLAIYQNSRRYAVGPSGPLLFMHGSLWNPPMGWGIWLTGAAVSCAFLVLAVALMGLNHDSAVSTDAA